VKPGLSALASGLLFGLGLGVSGMTLPSKVIGFLDVTGDWDPSLALVMMGALAVHFVLFRLVRRRPSPIFDTKFHVPTRTDLDGRLVAGAALFGVGWGLGGYCPGPGLVSAATGSVPALTFVLAMSLGMLAQHATQARADRHRQDRRHQRDRTSEPPDGSIAAAKGG
jgi:uncharacterized membrane protein YedE/YeeE